MQVFLATKYYLGTTLLVLVVATTMLKTLADLRLQDRLSPRKNPDFAWCLAFLPALVGYFLLLGAHLNAKPVVGAVKAYVPAFEQMVRSPIEVIAAGLGWTEGPLWVEDSAKSTQYLLFSDVLHNRVWRYDEGKGFFSVGKSVRIPLSGCKTNRTECALLLEPGSNGLARLYADPAVGADIVACQHGERAVSILFENGTRVPLVTHFEGQRLNSPNDLAWSNEGHLYFTDPTYGLVDRQRERFVGQELTHSGVYMVHRDQVRRTLRTGLPAEEVRLLASDLALPNGIVFSPGFVKAYVSNSDPKNAIWRVYDVAADGGFTNGRLFYDATRLIEQGHVGNPDGMAVDSKGNLYASGPGGVLVFSPEAQLLGRFIANRTVTNVAFGSGGMLYMTAADAVLRVRLAVKPAKLAGL